MAYSSTGKQVYASLSDLPQYTSIGPGDKLLVYNDSSSGPACVDFGDIIIDLDQCTFKSTISEMIDLASSIQAFVGSAAEEIEALQDATESLQKTIDLELRSRIKVLEYLVAVIIGANTSWQSDSGLEVLYDKFIANGISATNISDGYAAESEEKQHARGWYTALIGAITDMISRKTNEDVSNILLQSKFIYRYIEAVAKASSDDLPSSITQNINITTK